MGRRLPIYEEKVLLTTGYSTIYLLDIRVAAHLNGVEAVLNLFRVGVQLVLDLATSQHTCGTRVDDLVYHVNSQ